MAERNAAKVLPEPVGAATNTWCPADSAGQAATCASVGASKVRENHAATAGWNEFRTLMARGLKGEISVYQGRASTATQVPAVGFFDPAFSRRIIRLTSQPRKRTNNHDRSDSSCRG